jgi:nickel/cobalt exporter
VEQTVFEPPGFRAVFRRHTAILLLVTLGVLMTALVAPAVAQAHPLGNFTVNRHSLVQPSGSRIYVRYVLDMAEIPTYQAKPAVAAGGQRAYGNRLAASIGRGLRLSVDGRPVTLSAVRHRLAFPPGQAGLRTTRLEAVYESRPLTTRSALRLTYRDTNFAGRIGWKEIVVSATSGARVESTTASRASISRELRSYPDDLLRSPLDVTSASAVVDPARGDGVAPGLQSRAQLAERAGTRAVADSGFAGLIVRDELNIGFVLLSLLVAGFWGAAHALSPGHGKAVISAYLIGSRGTARHAVLLGLTTTITHTIGVFTLGLVTLTLSQVIVPEQLYPWLNLSSALLVLAVGIAVVRWRVGEWRRRQEHHDHHHHHHDHHHDHGHPHPEPGIRLRTLVGVGVSGGIIPCPTALVVLLAAISLHRIAFGLVLIVAFSVGLAAAITAIGVLAVSAKRVFNRMDFEGRVIRLLPAVSALVIVGVGVAMTARALPALT